MYSDMYLPLLYCIKAVVCRLYEMLCPCICNVVISCWKSGADGFFICRGGTDMCFVLGSGWKHLDLEQYRISGLTLLDSCQCGSMLLPLGSNARTVTVLSTRAATTWIR